MPKTLMLFFFVMLTSCAAKRETLSIQQDSILLQLSNSEYKLQDITYMQIDSVKTDSSVSTRQLLYHYIKEKTQKTDTMYQASMQDIVISASRQEPQKKHNFILYILAVFLFIFLVKKNK